MTLKDLVRALCLRRDVDPRQVVYLAADGMRARDLNRSIAIARDLTRSVDEGELKRRVWLLDEVTSIEGWTVTLKYLRDNTAFGDDTVVCAGSSWSETSDAERDLLAGRAGSASDRRVRLSLPMSFRDVLRATRPGVARPKPVDPWSLQEEPARRAAVELELFIDELDLAWQDYLTHGGYPRAVAEYTRTGAVGLPFAEDLIAWIHRDVDRDAPLESAAQLLAELQRRAGSPLNVTATATRLGYVNSSFALRLTRLVRNFAGMWCPQLDDAGRRRSGSQSKFYLMDPLLGWLGHQLRSGIEPPDMTALNESALALALAAAIERCQPGRWMGQDTIGYVRTGGGKEVDFGPVPVPTGGAVMETTPLEAKWVSQGWRPEARVIEGRFGRGIVATKDIFDYAHQAWALPAPVVALLLG